MIITIISIWFVASVTIGPALTWLFFYRERQARKIFSE